MAAGAVLRISCWLRDLAPGWLTPSISPCPLQAHLGFNDWQVGAQDQGLGPTSLWRGEGVDWWATQPFQVGAGRLAATAHLGGLPGFPHWLAVQGTGGDLLEPWQPGPPKPRPTSNAPSPTHPPHPSQPHPPPPPASPAQVPEDAFDLTFCFADGHGAYDSNDGLNYTVPVWQPRSQQGTAPRTIASSHVSWGLADALACAAREAGRLHGAEADWAGRPTPPKKSRCVSSLHSEAFPRCSLCPCRPSTMLAASCTSSI